MRPRNSIHPFIQFRGRGHLGKNGAKVAYSTRQQAIEAVKRRYYKDHKYFRAYKCGDHWHLTTHNPNAKRPRDFDKELVVMELGARAAGCLWSENHRKDRLKDLTKRFRAALTHRLGINNHTTSSTVHEAVIGQLRGARLIIYHQSDDN